MAKWLFKRHRTTNVLMFKSKVHQRKVYLPDDLRVLLNIDNGDTLVFRVIEKRDLTLIMVEKDCSQMVQEYIAIHKQVK